jgi:hypothetical protein
MLAYCNYVVLEPVMRSYNRHAGHYMLLLLDSVNYLVKNFLTEYVKFS